MTKLFSILVITMALTTQVQATSLSQSVMAKKMADKSNYVFSNASVDGLLSLVGPGYDESRQQVLTQYWDGVSIDDMGEKVQELSRSEEGLTVSVNNQVWLNNQFSFLPQYEQALAKNFGITPQLMNVSNPDIVAGNVNQWASDSTNKLIKEVIKPDMITQDLVSILANAVYFKGEWQTQFKEDNTVDGEFYGVSDPVAMMTQVPERGVTLSDNKPVMIKMAMDHQDGVLTIELPFKGESHSLVIAMAAKQDRNDQQYTIDHSYSQNGAPVADVFSEYIDGGKAFDYMKSVYADEVQYFQMPKFEIESDIEAIEAMISDLGYGSLFARGALGNMVDDPRAALSKVFQKAKIIINEKGGEAAAVTVGMVTVESISYSNDKLLINGPFAYAIRDNQANVTLFEGIVTNPLVKE